MKVVMFFIGNSTVGSENIINTWLAEHKDIEIKHILQSADGTGLVTALISIWYNEIDKEDIS